MSNSPTSTPESLGLPRLITVCGLGKVSVPADLVEVQVSISWTAPSLLEAKEVVAEKVVRAEEYLSSQGIGGDQLGARSLQNYHHADSKPEIINFTITSTFVVRLYDVDSVEAIVNGLIDEIGDGITLGRFVRRSHDPNAGYEEALAIAYGDAERQARAYAAVAGVELGEVFSMREAGPMTGRAVAAASTRDLPLDAEEVDTVVSVEVKFQFS